MKLCVEINERIARAKVSRVPFFELKSIENDEECSDDSLLERRHVDFLDGSIRKKNEKRRFFIDNFLGIFPQCCIGFCSKNNQFLMIFRKIQHNLKGKFSFSTSKNEKKTSFLLDDRSNHFDLQQWSKLISQSMTNDWEDHRLWRDYRDENDEKKKFVWGENKNTSSVLNLAMTNLFDLMFLIV